MTATTMPVPLSSMQVALLIMMQILVRETTAVDTSNTSSPSSSQSTESSPPKEEGETEATVTIAADDVITEENKQSFGSENTSQPQKSPTSSSSDNYDSNNHDKSNEHFNYYNGDQHNNNPKSYSKYDDEQTYLDLFGERAKELLTQHIIPSTDAYCRWDWRMGRCEPYCECRIQFLWGDYHLGRSCRRRPQTLQSISEEKAGERSWQEAWQEVWQSQWTERKHFPTFVPITFPKTMDDTDTIAHFPLNSRTHATWETTATCTLPPESRYTLIVQHLTQLINHSTVILQKFQNVQRAALNISKCTKTLVQHQWYGTRERACQVVKGKVNERERERSQPVVLTRRGMVWIRRLCGTAGGSMAVNGETTDGDGIDEADEMQSNV